MMKFARKIGSTHLVVVAEIVVLGLRRHVARDGAIGADQGAAARLESSIAMAVGVAVAMVRSVAVAVVSRQILCGSSAAAAAAAAERARARPGRQRGRSRSACVCSAQSARSIVHRSHGATCRRDRTVAIGAASLHAQAADASGTVRMRWMLRMSVRVSMTVSAMRVGEFAETCGEPAPLANECGAFESPPDV